MANIKSSQKKNRQRIVHEARNNSQKSAMRTAVKRLRVAIESKDANNAQALLPPAIQLIDRLGRKGVIEKNAASRTVSRLTVAVGGLK